MIKGHETHHLNNNLQFTNQQINSIRLSLSKRYKLEQGLTKFEYKNNLSYSKNIILLSQTLQQLIDLQTNLKNKFIQSFSTYISSQQNIPIQINLKKIRYQQLINLVDQWEIQIKEPSLLRPSERLYSIEHRNILFSRVFVQQKQNIQSYFETLSDKKMLKGVDLYQLLVDILSHYCLYQFKTDNQTFFEKVNSFNNFLQVVNKFINTETRIIIDNKSKDFEYIKLYQFEALIYFWESINPQLELRSDKRFNICSKQIQTQKHQIHLSINQETQTIDRKDKVLTLEQIINGGLKSLNKLTQIQSDFQKLEIIQNLCQCLRKQKIKLVQYEKNKSPRKRSQSPRHFLQINNRQQRFLYANSQQSDIELQKTQRIVSKGYEQMKDQMSKRKLQCKQYKDLSMQSGGTTSVNLKVPDVSSKLRTPQKMKSKKQIKNNQTQVYNQISISVTQPTKLYSNYIQQRNNSTISQQELFKIYKLKLKSQASQYSGNEYHEVYSQKSGQKSLLNLFEKIYDYYSDKSTKFMSIQRLNQFFADIGIISEKQSVFKLKALRANQIKNINKIMQIEFLQIMGLVMKEDEDLTYEVISEFVDLYVKSNDKSIFKNQIKIPNYAKTNKYQPNLKARETYQTRQKLSSDEAEFKYTHVPIYSIQNNSTSSAPRKRSSETSNRKRRYNYCQQTPNFQGQSFASRFNQFGNNLHR